MSEFIKEVLGSVVAMVGLVALVLIVHMVGGR